MNTLSIEEKKTPVLFVGHGSPMNAIEDNEFTQGWQTTAAQLPRPKAILCISAHWESIGSRVTALPMPPTIHDFGGFPEALYRMSYPAPGSVELADRIVNLYGKVEVRSDEEWGLDHGCWSILARMYPDADIPVVQLSLDRRKTPEEHYEFAKVLKPLREEGILILGSGNIVHNLRKVAWDKMDEPDFGYDWAHEASATVRRLIEAGDHEALCRYSSLGEAVRLAIPTPEHYLPLLYILALRDDHEPIQFFNDSTVMGSLSMTSLRIG